MSATTGKSFLGFSPRAHAVFVLVLAAAALLAYSNNFTAEFVYDDYPFILENPAVRTLSDAGRFFLDRESFSDKGQYIIYRPLATLSFALNYRLSGYSSAAYHTANIALHVACGLALYVFLRAAFSDSLFAFLVSLLFLLHPVQTEAVAWVSGRGNPMFLLFLLLAVICYGRWSANAPRGGIFYGLALLFAALSLLSKEMAIVLPLLLIVYDVSVNRPREKERWRGRLLAVVPFLALSIAYVILRHLVLGETRQAEYWSESVWPTLLTMTEAFAYYVRLMFVPRPLLVEYVVSLARSPLQATAVVSILALFAIGAICVLSYRRTPLLFFGIAWFFVSLLPVSNIVPLQAVINERFLYLPSIGFCLVLASPILTGRAKLSKGAFRGMVAALLMIALCYGALTFDRNRDWRNSLSLWTASVKASPAGPTSRYNLGVELHRRGRDDEAIEHLKIACMLREEFPSAHGLLGNIYSAQGKYAAAIGEYEIGLAHAPDDSRLKHNLAMAWFEKGKAHAERNETEMAVRSFLKTLKYEPGFEAAMEALEELRKGIEPEHSPRPDPKPREAL